MVNERAVIKEIVLTYTTDKDDSFETLSNEGDEWQQEQGPLAASSAPFGQGVLFRIASSGLDAVVEGLGQLDPPLDSGSVHLEEG